MGIRLDATTPTKQGKLSEANVEIQKVKTSINANIDDNEALSNTLTSIVNNAGGTSIHSNDGTIQYPNVKLATGISVTDTAPQTQTITFTFSTAPNKSFAAVIGTSESAAIPAGTVASAITAISTHFNNTNLDGWIFDSIVTVADTSIAIKYRRTRDAATPVLSLVSSIDTVGEQTFVAITSLDVVGDFGSLDNAELNATMLNSSANTALSASNTATTNTIAAGTTAESKGTAAETKGSAAETKGDYANTQGDYAKTQGDAAAAKLASLNISLGSSTNITTAQNINSSGNISADGTMLADTITLRNPITGAATLYTLGVDDDGDLTFKVGSGTPVKVADSNREITVATENDFTALQTFTANVNFKGSILVDGVPIGLSQPATVERIPLTSFTATETNTDISLTNANDDAISPASIYQLEVYSNGIFQYPGVDYTLSGSIIALTVPYVTGDEITILYDNSSIATPADGSVTTAKIEDLAVTNDKIANTTITNAKLAGSISNDKITSLAASKLTGALPAISGASLTNLPIPTTAIRNTQFSTDSESITAGGGGAWPSNSSDSTSTTGTYTTTGSTGIVKATVDIRRSPAQAQSKYTSSSLSVNVSGVTNNTKVDWSDSTVLATSNIGETQVYFFTVNSTGGTISITHTANFDPGPGPNKTEAISTNYLFEEFTA